MMLVRFYCIVIHSSRMLNMIGIKEISFIWHQISLDLQPTWGCHYACSINSEQVTYDVDQILLYCDSLFLNVKHDRYQGNQFYMASDLPRFANYMGLSLRM